jgi:hypothetical protein
MSLLNEHGHEDSSYQQITLQFAHLSLITPIPYVSNLPHLLGKFFLLLYITIPSSFYFRLHNYKINRYYFKVRNNKEGQQLNNDPVKVRYA